MKKKRTIFKMAVLTLMVVSSLGANAQTHWTFSYDATGNRVQRNVSFGSAARQTAIIDYIDKNKIN